MLLFFLTSLLGAFSLASAAVLHPARQVQPTVAANSCPLTVVTQYVTVTQIPEIVTIAVPDSSAISSSLASASKVDSLVVVESSQDAPVNAPKPTNVPTFIQSIVVPAFQATELPHTGSSAVYVSLAPSASAGRPAVSQSVVIGVTTISIGGPTSSVDPGLVIVTVTDWAATVFTTTTMTVKNAIATDSAWNNSTDVNALSGTDTSLPTSNSLSVVTAIVNATSAVIPYTFDGYGGSRRVDGRGNKKRQTCTMISANFDGQWASWCNNWDGSTTLPYTSWETTVVPTSMSDVGGSTSASSSANSPVAPGESTSDAPSSSSTPPPPPTGADASPQTTSSAPDSAVQSGCGETGRFNIGFDNLPAQSVFNESDAGFAPIFNPFDHFYWANGWSYVPPPSDPYPPHNGNQLAVYVPTPTDVETSSPDANLVPAGGFGAGRRSSLDQYWFNAESAWIGCDNNGTDPSGTCDFVAEGYRYDNMTGQNTIVVTQHYSQPLCHDATCHLEQIFFGDMFVQLSLMTFYAKIGAQARTFYMDDMDMSWWNNTCEAGQMRASTRK